MSKRIFIRCSISSTSNDQYFVKKLQEWGFHIDEIKPVVPNNNEFTAYEVRGRFDSEWDDFFDICKKISTDVKLLEIKSELME